MPSPLKSAWATLVASAADAGSAATVSRPPVRAAAVAGRGADRKCCFWHADLLLRGRRPGHPAVDEAPIRHVRRELSWTSPGRHERFGDQETNAGRQGLYGSSSG